MKKVIVGLGELLWDIFGTKKVLGGAPTNFSYLAFQFGYEAYSVSAVGDDDNGREILTSLDQKGLNHIIYTVDYPTGTVDVELDHKGVPTYTIHENVAWDNIPFNAQLKALAEKTDALSFGSLAQRSEVSRQTILEFIHHMPANALKLFDVNLRQRFYNKEILEESMRMSNILKINDEEILTVAELLGYNENDEKKVCKMLQNSFNFDIIILTKGVDGSIIFTKKEVSEMGTPMVEVVDTVGAGDSFAAAFIVSHLKGRPLKESHQLAVDVSAFVCTQQGGMPELPTLYIDAIKDIS